MLTKETKILRVLSGEAEALRVVKADTKRAKRIICGIVERAKNKYVFDCDDMAVVRELLAESENALKKMQANLDTAAALIMSLEDKTQIEGEYKFFVESV